MKTSFYFLAQPSQKCSLSDSACIKQAAQTMVSVLTAGIPELGTEVLDVMHVDRIKVELAGLKLNIRDADIKGLKHTVVDEIRYYLLLVLLKCLGLVYKYINNYNIPTHTYKCTMRMDK